MTYTASNGMKRILVIAIFALVLTGIAQPAFAAAGPGLVPCGHSPINLGADPGDPHRPCSPCDFLVLFKTLVNFALYTITPIVAILLFLFSGFMILLGGAKPEMMNQGKTMFFTTVIALVVIYGSFLVTNFIIATFAPNSDVAQGWFKLDCNNPEDVIPTDGGYDPTKAASGGGGSGLTYNDKEEILLRKSFRDQGIQLWDLCTADDKSQCIILSGMKVQTMNEIFRLNADCKSKNKLCQLVITGGTENISHDPGQYSHQSGYKFDVDKGSSPVLDGLIRGYGPPIGNRKSDGAPVYKSPDGTFYADENSHWDACVGCPPPTLQ